MRLVIQRVITRLTGLTSPEFEEQLFQKSTNKIGVESTKLSTRALADLASALEKTQSMTYAALNDSAQDRSKRKENGDDSDVSAGDLHAQISAGLAAVRASSTPRAQLFDAQIAQAEQLVKEAKVIPSPLNNDNH
jgi:hypothetical protein